MKIAFSAQLLLDNYKTGIGWLAQNVVNELKELNFDNEYVMDFFILGDKKYKKYSDTIYYYKSKGFKIDICRWFSYALYKMIWPFVPIPYNIFMKEKVDVTLFFNYYIPPGVKGKKVVMIHDMAYLAYPETVNKKTLYMLKLNVKKSCKAADRIITISQFSKQEIIKYLGVDDRKIEVMPVGVDFNTFKICKDSKVIDSVKKKYGIDGSYFLYLGTLEPRKNIVRMIDAYAMLKRENESVPKFVIAGRKGWMYDEIFERVKKYGIEKDVIFTGYVEENEVPLLMNGAEAFLFVSLYEGFGMPILEAMACGTPVITSNTASMPEVIGDCGILVNPLSPEEIKNGMKRIIENKFEADDMAKRALERSKCFTWENAAKKVLSVFKSIC